MLVFGKEGEGRRAEWTGSSEGARASKSLISGHPLPQVDVVEDSVREEEEGVDLVDTTMGLQMKSLVSTTILRPFFLFLCVSDARTVGEAG